MDSFDYLIILIGKGGKYEKEKSIGENSYINRCFHLDDVINDESGTGRRGSSND